MQSKAGDQLVLGRYSCQRIKLQSSIGMKSILNSFQKDLYAVNEVANISDTDGCLTL